MKIIPQEPPTVDDPRASRRIVTLLSIDPGPTQSGYVVMRRDMVIAKGVAPNNLMRGLIETNAMSDAVDAMVLEKIASMGLSVGQDVFETAVWTGRFMEIWNRVRKEDPMRIKRVEVKLNLCGTARAKDTNVMTALLDRFGGKQKAKGTKAVPGPLYGVSTHMWAALAVGCTAFDLINCGEL